jgi:branched-chain amino acid transport system ATP-binding protein
MPPRAGSRGPAVLEVHRVAKAFDGFQAVAGVSLAVERGQIAAIIGPNGAGKTTLFNLITGHLRPDAGAVALDGRDITGLPPHDVCRLGMGRSFQRTNIFPRLTVFQNVQAAFISHRGRGLDVWSRVDRLYRDETEALLASLGLLDRAGEMSGFLSHGAQKQLELGIALASEPRLLLLDEPTAGMSAAETRETIQLISRIAGERGLTLLFTEHDMEVVFSIAQQLTVLHQGRVIAEGAPAEVRGDPEVRRVYLGERR